jgi:membrane fusion protein (multidrug efflux system)
MKSKKLMYGALAVALAALWYWRSSSGAPAPSAVDTAADAPSALVQTMAPVRRPLELAMTVFGEVAPVKVESVSFAQAGQVSRVAVTPGQTVQRGQLIATVVTDPAALTAYAQAASGLSFARREEARMRELLALQLATQSQVDSAAKQARDAEAVLAAQEKLGGNRAGAELTAPFDGVVAALGVAQGDRVASGAMIAQLGRTDSLRINLALEPSRAGEVRPGMPVRFETGGGAAAALTAPITSIHNVIDPKTLMASAIVLLPQAAAQRWPVGMRVQGRIALGRRDGWELPRQAVLSDDNGAYVFEVSGRTAHRLAVRKLTETAASIGIDGALDAARPVVVLGNYELKDGMAVRGGKP